MIIKMHLYFCDDCIMDFAIEAHEDINQDDAHCPICGGENLEDAGYGEFAVLIPAEAPA